MGYFLGTFEQGVEAVAFRPLIHLRYVQLLFIHLFYVKCAFQAIQPLTNLSLHANSHVAFWGLDYFSPDEPGGRIDL